MAQATMGSMNSTISSDDVEGTDVYGADRDKIGEIDHLIIDKVSGKIAFAVMSFGGFLGLGEKHYPIPWGALKYDTSLGGYITGITEDQVKNSPDYSEDSYSDRNWQTQTYSHYKVPAYWS